VWSDIWNPRANRLMFDDIDMPAMMQIASEVLRDNLSGFFSTLPASSEPAINQTAPVPLGSIS
jgi:hypothetical protein